jgi:hypothetical protein
VAAKQGQSLPKASIPEAELWDCVARVREARYVLLRDAEAFHDSAKVLEWLGRSLTNRSESGLAGYHECLLGLARLGAGADSAQVGPTFEAIRLARNQAAHEGAFVRHRGGVLSDFLSWIERGLFMSYQPADLRVCDVMVRDVAVAQPWHTCSTVRQTMLRNSFSYLPSPNGDAAAPGWVMIADLDLAGLFLGAPNRPERERREAMSVADAVKGRLLTLKGANEVGATELVKDFVKRYGPVPMLVVDRSTSEPRLLGIVSAFDLLS